VRHSSFKEKYSKLSLQFRVQGHSKNTEILINHLGACGPTSFMNDSRRANDGCIYFGQNKFDDKGNQINDFIIEFTSNNPKNSIVKEEFEKARCPERLRGQHCKVFYDYKDKTFKVVDMGAGIGTFLKCRASNDGSLGSKLEQDMIIQIGANMYALVNILSRQQYLDFTSYNNS
jgi:hypothetical protein